MRTNIFLIMTLSVILSSCSGGGGGGGGGGTSPAASLTGTFVDAAVQGLKYTSTSHNGVTDVNGNFTCKTGENVEFYLRGTTQDIFVGDITCRKVVSPIELVSGGTKTVEDGLASLTTNELRTVRNALRLLQTLDSNNNPSDGISINQTDVDTLISAFNLTDLDEDLGNALETNEESQMDTDLNTLVTAIGGNRTAVSQASAVSHFETTIANCREDSCSGNGDEETNGNTPGENEEVLSDSTFKGYRKSVDDMVTEVSAVTVVPTGDVISLAQRYYMQVNNRNARDVSFAVYEAQCLSSTYNYSLVSMGGSGTTLISLKVVPNVISGATGTVSIVEHSYTDEAVSTTIPTRKEHSTRDVSYSCSNGKVSLGTDGVDGDFFSNGQVIVAKLKNPSNSNNTMYVGGRVLSTYTSYPNYVEFDEYFQTNSSGQNVSGCVQGQQLPSCGGLGQTSSFVTGSQVTISNFEIESPVGNATVFRMSSSGNVVGNNSRHFVTKVSGGLAVTAMGVQIEIDLNNQLFLAALVDGVTIGESAQCPQVSGTDRKCSGATGILFGAGSSF